MQKTKELIIRFLPNESVTESVCKALSPQKNGCKQEKLHQTVKPSLKQDELGATEGDEAFLNGEWRSQLGVMLG